MVIDTWEREDAKGNWTEYSKPTVSLLEAASLCGLANVKIKENKKDLIVDLTKNVQTTKTKRGSKNVRRIKVSDAGNYTFSVFLWVGLGSGNITLCVSDDYLGTKSNC